MRNQHSRTRTPDQIPTKVPTYFTHVPASALLFLIIPNKGHRYRDFVRNLFAFYSYQQRSIVHAGTFLNISQACHVKFVSPRFSKEAANKGARKEDVGQSFTEFRITDSSPIDRFNLWRTTRTTRSINFLIKRERTRTKLGTLVSWPRETTGLKGRQC